ncbi:MULTISPECIES: hypothetical protein [unclassified Burkholderia]|uniref:hypothetical protein n=1 Tax=unclassified Burkholderia TaxID=2613784 RepID=UPI00214FFDB7|nr:MULTISPECIES: hypothetical protein [unclassified Burkholderia]MCR4471480.1 hypothetical protein [Burkholderia sp. SCN-KJ]
MTGLALAAICVPRLPFGPQPAREPRGLHGHCPAHAGAAGRGHHVQSRSRNRGPDFSVVSLKSSRRDFPLADAAARCTRRRAAVPEKYRTAAPALRFAFFAPFCGDHPFSPRNDALPKVWKSAQKMYLERRNWIDTLQSLNQRRQPRDSGIDLGSKRAIDGDTCEVRGFRYQLVGMTEWPQI